MRNIWTIMKKEFARFFKDRRLVTAIFLPGILIYVLYSLLGGIIFDTMLPSEDTTYTVYTVNAPETFEEELALFGKFEVTVLTPQNEEEIEKARGQVRDEILDLVIMFPENFSLSSPSTSAIVDIYYNSVSTLSSTAYQLVVGYLSAYQYGAPAFTITPTDTATEEDFSGMMFSMIGPMLVLTLLFAGCMSIAPESIAGEKERGTFATMLVTPVKRRDIAIGKILSLTAISVLGGVCSFLGVVLSLPKLMGGELTGLGTVSYTFGDYAALFGIVLSTVLVMVALVSVVSTLAKSVKEATSMVGPLTVVAMLCGLSTMFVNADAWYLYLIPIFNSANAMSAVFSSAGNPLYSLLTIGVNLVAAFALAVLLAKMFDDERVMFNK